MNSFAAKLPRRALVCAIAAATTLAFAQAASASVTGWNEPAFTKTPNTNTYWWNWTAVKGLNDNGTDNYTYYLCFSTYQNGNQVEFTNHTNGPGSQNCTNSLVTSAWTTTAPSGSYGAQPFNGPASPLTDGHNYYMCATGAYRWPFIWRSDTASTNSCPSSTIDNNQPSVQVDVNGTAEYTNDPNLHAHIVYNDATSGPWPANYRCIAVGANNCGTAGNPYNYDPNCSVPAGNGFNFYCDLDASGVGDQTVHFCAAASDSAIPDNASAPNQFVYASNSQPVNSTTSNISNAQCGYVTIDRTAPQVTAAANATTVTAGDLVTFTASSNDGGSGVSNNYTWIFGDNTPNGSGSSTTHSYTQPGTYVAKVTTTDGAGNTGEGTQTITVRPLSTGGGGNSVPGGTSSGGTISQTPPSNNQISQQVGGGGTQTQTVGGLGVIAPKRAKITKRLKNLPIALNATQPGKVDLALVRGGRIVSQAAAVLGEAGTFGLRMKLPRRLKPGTYQLRVTFTPMGSTEATTKTLRIKFTKKRKARGSAARSFRGVPDVDRGAPYKVKPVKRPRPIKIG